MRDVLLLAFILGAAPICLFRPYIGVLLWFWITLMSPRGYVYGVATEFPLAVIIAVPTLIGTFLTSTNRRWLPKQLGLILVFWAWTVVTYLHCRQVPILAAHQTEGWNQLLEFSKMLLMSMVAVLLVTSKERLRYLMLLTAFCLGVLALKGAIWGVLTGGAYRVYGPHRSFLSDNNDFALALNMTMAISFFLAKIETSRKLRIALWVLFGSSIICVVLSYSRGGLAALAVVLLVLTIKSRHKLIGALLAAIVVFGILTVLPGGWQSRMSDIFVHGQLDDSAEERLVVWEYSWNLAQAFPITGGGFECFTPELFAQYETRPLPSNTYTALGPHSIYFQVLAEHGFVGLFLFLTLLLSCLWSLYRLGRASKIYPEVSWMKPYCDMLLVGFLAYLVGGAFLGRAYFDVIYEFVACVLILKILYRRAMMSDAQESPVIQVEEAYSIA